MIANLCCLLSIILNELALFEIPLVLLLLLFPFSSATIGSCEHVKCAPDPFDKGRRVEVIFDGGI